MFWVLTFEHILGLSPTSNVIVLYCLAVCLKTTRFSGITQLTLCLSIHDAVYLKIGYLNYNNLFVDLLVSSSMSNEMCPSTQRKLGIRAHCFSNDHSRVFKI